SHVRTVSGVAARMADHPSEARIQSGLQAIAVDQGLRMVLAALGLHESSALLVAGENVPKRTGLRLESVERVEVRRHPRADVVHRGDHSADGGEDPGAGQLGRVQTAVEVDTDSWCQVREVGVVEPGAREPERSED